LNNYPFPIEPQLSKTSLFVFDDRMLIVLPALQAGQHYHQALAIMISVYQPLHIQSSDTRHTCHTALIAPDTLYQYGNTETPCVAILLDPEAAITQQIISRHLAATRITSLDPLLPYLIPDTLHRILNQDQPCEVIFNLMEQNLARLVDGPALLEQTTDPRIQLVLELIRALPVKKIALTELAGAVYLSESRLLHLFREQVGMPFRRYLLWKRLIQALQHILDGMPLTQAAYEAEFADSAHFSRTFKRMFGFTLSFAFKNSQFIQVIACRMH
jgi:AraC-like DNA-binding protein